MVYKADQELVTMEVLDSRQELTTIICSVDAASGYPVNAYPSTYLIQHSPIIREASFCIG